MKHRSWISMGLAALILTAALVTTRFSSAVKVFGRTIPGALAGATPAPVAQNTEILPAASSRQETGSPSALGMPASDGSATPVLSAAPTPTAGAAADPTSAPPALSSLFGGSQGVAAPRRVTCQPPPVGDYATCLFSESFGLTMTFYLYVPEQFDASRKYPLVLLLEGGGERASLSNSAE